MKILAILTFYYPHWTGLTAHAVAVAEGLAARGHQVTVLTTRHLPELPRDETINGVRVIRLQPVAQFSRGKITPAFPLAAAQLIAAHDVVQIHTPLPEAPIVATLCRTLRRPLLMTHHGDVVMPEGGFNQFVQRSAFVVLSAAGRMADAVTSYSRDYAEHSRLLRQFEGKLHYVYPPVDIVAPSPGGADAWRAELGLVGKPVIGIAGRWVEEKGFDYLLQAMPLIREQHPGAHLVYAGEQNVVYDNFYERCQPLIEQQQEHISFVGLIRDPQRMADFYAMCDLFALPSRTDMLALVQVEAMLCGTPVVASDIPGARVVVRETGFGRLAPPHDPAGLAATIAAVLDEPERYRPTAEAVRRIFNTNKTLSQYEEIMREIIRKAAPDGQRIDQARRQARAAWQTLGGPALLAPSSNGAGLPATTHLSEADRETLGRLLQNEADMAFRRRALALLDYLDLHDGETVLDCGCGMGVYLMMMGRLRNLKLYGVDGDLERLHWAEREQVRASLSGVDIHKLPFADNTFDKILMSEVLEHLAEDRGALREIYRVLKPGGILALSVPHANYPFWWDPFNKVIEAVGGRPMRGNGPVAGIWSNHWRLYRPEELRDVLGSAGFAVEELNESTHYSFPFIHFLVYGLGKPLLELNLLPKALRNSADRFRGEANSGSLLNPINLGVRVFRRFDSQNDAMRGDEQTFVNLVARARKPS
ncbi:MAG: hypothetical protein OHK0022_27580 [Roseiflexaceae bacterium]